jgi:hypothetical protein
VPGRIGVVVMPFGWIPETVGDVADAVDDAIAVAMLMAIEVNH